MLRDFIQIVDKRVIEGGCRCDALALHARLAIRTSRPTLNCIWLVGAEMEIGRRKNRCCLGNHLLDEGPGEGFARAKNCLVYSAALALAIQRGISFDSRHRVPWKIEFGDNLHPVARCECYQFP